MEEKFTSLNLTLNECKEKHLCPVCGKETSLHSASTKKNPKWKMFCSNDCKYSELGKHITTEIQRELFEIKKNSPEYKELVKKANEKREETNLKKRGVKYPLQSKKCQNKFRQTCRENIGFDNPMQSEKIKETHRESVRVSYGYDYATQSPIVKAKTKRTLNEMGVDNVSQLPEVKEKKRQTFMEHLKVDCNFKDKNFRENSLKKFRKKHWDYFVNALNQKSIIPLFEKADYVEQNEKSHCFHCNICDKDFTIEEKNTYPQKIYCPSTSHNNKSYAENEIYEWLKSIGIENIERNKRDWHKDTIYEADIFLTDHNLAIEYNGLYWHCNLNKDDDYHYNKWKFFKDMNIDCIQIFENEWRDNKEVVKGIILNHIGKSERIYGRKCNIKEIPNNEYMDFLNLNHLQGYCKAKVKLGLYYENELIMCMSFSKPRFSKKYDWENIRTCSKVGCSVVGGFSKLIHYFKENYNGSVVSYVDSRYFNGKGYIENGFECINHSSPNYFYFKNHKLNLLNRMKFQKHKLKHILEKYDENLTEKDNMSANEYLWIYDCGNDIMVLNTNERISVPDDEK